MKHNAWFMNISYQSLWVFLSLYHINCLCWSLMWLLHVAVEHGDPLALKLRSPLVKSHLPIFLIILGQVALCCSENILLWSVAICSLMHQILIVSTQPLAYSNFASWWADTFSLNQSLLFATYVTCWHTPFKFIVLLMLRDGENESPWLTLWPMVELNEKLSGRTSRANLAKLSRHHQWSWNHRRNHIA